LVFRSGEDKIERWYIYPPSETARIKIHNIVSSIIDDASLNITDEPLKIRLSVREEPRWEYLELELSEPLWNPVFYHDKTIEDVEIHELGEGKKQAIIKISDSHEQIVKIWNATVQESKQELELYEGKTIDYIWANTEVTVTEGDFETAKEVALQDVLKEPDKYHGKRIRTKGFYDFQLEIMGFHDRKGNNLWIGHRSSFFDRKNQKILTPNPVEGLILGRHRGYATVEGIFLKGPAGHGGFWPGEIVRITRFDTHFKIDHTFWLSLLAIVLTGVFYIKTIRKTTPPKTPNKTEDTPENGAN
jgi:hypothetical protein